MVFKLALRIRQLSVLQERAETENTGARALMTVCESLLRDFKFELPGTAVSELTIDADLIDKHDEVLAEYRELGKRGDVAKTKEEVVLYCREFHEQHEIKIVFTDEAIELLGAEAAKQARSPLCRYVSSVLKIISLG